MKNLEMHNKKVFVTGAGGYIGRHVVSVLCDAGTTVLIPSHRAERVDSRAVRMNVDIFNNSENIFEETGSPDVCLHMAWRDGFVHASDAHMQNLSSHYTFLKNMMAGGLKQVVVMGSMHEIGYHEGEICEDTPCNPITMYGIAKDALRKATFALGKKYDTCVQWIRAYYILGDDANNHSVFSKMLEADAQGQNYFPFTSGKNKFDFIHVDELAMQIACVTAQTEVSGIIECCSGTPVSLGERAEQFIRENNLKIKLKYGEFKEPATESPAVWGCSRKINMVKAQLFHE